MGQPIETHISREKIFTFLEKNRMQLNRTVESKVKCVRERDKSFHLSYITGEWI